MLSSGSIKKKRVRPSHVTLPSGRKVRRDTSIYHRRKARLMADMGGICAKCGTDEKLEFDHIQGIGWDASKISAKSRVSRYRREFEAGLLQLLCGPCNKAKGRPKPVDAEQPF